MKKFWSPLFPMTLNILLKILISKSKNVEELSEKHLGYVEKITFCDLHRNYQILFQMISLYPKKNFVDLPRPKN